MRFGFIGAGKVGIAMGIYLKAKGFLISGYCSRTQASSLQAATRTQSSYYGSLEQLAEASDIIFITTSDDQIQGVVMQLCEASCLRAGQLIVHMSGALPSTILAPLKAYGCHVCSIHPLQAFADVEKSAAELSSAFFCLEGDEKGIYALEEILRACSNPYFKLQPEQKALYHASACMLSNYLVTLIHNSLMLMEDLQIDQPTALKAMMPLVNSTLQNAMELGAENALTGPIARGDFSTVQKHLEAISASSKEQLPLYAFMAKETLKLAALAKLKDTQQIKKLETLIESYIE